MNGSMLVATLLLSGGLGTPTQPPPTQTIVNGTDAAVCQFPATVVMLEGDETPTMCSGTLVHPELAITAAHCINEERPIVGVGFGETATLEAMPERVVVPTECVEHPGWDAQGYPDLAFCRLEQPVTDVPIVPLLTSCELDLIPVGTEVTIVGFGSVFGFFDNMGELNAEGAGTKRYITQEIYDHEPVASWVGLSDGSGNGSACFGDSGGTGYVQLPDGTWRVFGVASQLFDPGGLPPPMDPMNLCGAGATYVIAGDYLDWYEMETGLDLSPCWDDLGSWVGGCDDVPVAPDVAAGTWELGCAGGPVAPHVEQCLAGGGSTGGSDSGTSGGGDTTSGTSSGSSSGGGGGDTSSGATVSSTGLAADGTGDGDDDGPAPGSTSAAIATGSSAGADDGAGADGGDGGCSCRYEGRGSTGWLWLLVFGLGIRSTSRRAP